MRVHRCEYPLLFFAQQHGFPFVYLSDVEIDEGSILREAEERNGVM